MEALNIVQGMTKVLNDPKAHIFIVLEVIAGV